jgi:riboflavin kinase/FMN adenylyltransferase
MQQHFALESFKLDRCWVTIGSFDGVHLGHQHVIRQVVENAHQHNEPAVVITFSPHPAVVLRGISGPFYLTSFEQKAGLIESLGVDHLITLPFTEALSRLTARQFMQQLVSQLGMKELVTGFDFKIGHKREGTPAVLAMIGQDLGFNVTTLAPFILDGVEISSSRVRTLLSQGQVAQANIFLGRTYTLQGKIIEGEGRGRMIGYPTANLALPPELLLPMRGVYATLVHLGSRVLPSLTNIGLRPTFHQRSSLNVETHILDFDEMIYHQQLTIEFVSFIRPEQRFYSTHELTEQIEMDITEARKVLEDAA